MIVGILQVSISIDGAESLKDKRRVLNRIKDKLHREHQVSVAEVGNPDVFATATVGIAMASSDGKYCRSVLDQVLEKLSHGRDFYVTDHQIEVLTGE